MVAGAFGGGAARAFGADFAFGAAFAFTAFFLAAALSTTGRFVFARAAAVAATRFRAAPVLSGFADRARALGAGRFAGRFAPDVWVLRRRAWGAGFRFLLAAIDRSVRRIGRRRQLAQAAPPSCEQVPRRGTCTKAGVNAPPA
ncbi:MAG TPA: hypothetical protein VHB21_24455 [Minicystis sp.]|nr:hypothetical protein [Minicystis sp.]